VSGGCAGRARTSRGLVHTSVDVTASVGAGDAGSSITAGCGF
jgi:hypothetical protein